MSALRTDENARIAATHRAALLIMHSVGRPKQKHTHIVYEDVLAALEEFFEEKIALAMAAGVEREAIVLDPGIDFAKQSRIISGSTGNSTDSNVLNGLSCFLCREKP